MVKGRTRFSLLNKNNFQQESEETVNQKLYFGCCDFFLCMKRVLGYT